MKIHSLHVGKPKPLTDKIMSSIGRSPVDELIVHKDFIEGDEVSHKKFHGGPKRVLHVYPIEHYQTWKNTFKLDVFTPGSIGENITSIGLTEDSVCVGDVIQIGEVQGQLTEPRYPCGLIDLKYGIKLMHRECLKQSKLGWFYSIIQKGQISLNDEIKLIDRPYPELVLKNCIQSVVEKTNQKILTAMTENPILADSWKSKALKAIK